MSLYRMGADAGTRKAAAVTDGGALLNPHAETAKKAADAQSDALSTLAMFIPAETIAIYITVANVLLATFPNDNRWPWAWYWVCVALSALFVWIGFAITWRKNNGGNYPAWAVAPRFRLFAAAIAFASWGLAISAQVTASLFCHNSDLACPSNSAALAGALVIVVAVVLSALDRLVNYDHPIAPKPPAAATRNTLPPGGP